MQYDLPLLDHSGLYRAVFNVKGKLHSVTFYGSTPEKAKEFCSTLERLYKDGELWVFKAITSKIQQTLAQDERRRKS